MDRLDQPFVCMIGTKETEETSLGLYEGVLVCESVCAF